MKYYPIFLDIKDKNCLVVGAGPVGVRKAFVLNNCGANVTLVSLDFSVRLDDLKNSSIVLEKKKYVSTDMKETFLVFAATNNKDLNGHIKMDAKGLNILCNVADASDSSDFILPSVVDREDLILAVSTSGSSPALAKRIKEDLAREYGSEYAILLEMMKNIRIKLLKQNHAPDQHKIIFHSLLEKGLLDLIETKNWEKIDAILKDNIGKEFTFKSLVSSRSYE